MLNVTLKYRLQELLILYMHKKKIILVSLLLFTSMVIAGCQLETEQTTDDEGKIQVMVSILPMVQFVEKIGGDSVSVKVLIPPGYEPHSYELSASQLKDIANADLYVKTGQIEFEQAYMDDIIEQNQEMLVVDGSDGISLRQMEQHNHEDEKTEDGEHDEAGLDPHTWLSTKNAEIYSDNIYKALVQLEPSNQSYYEKNKKSYIAELKNARTTITTQLDKIIEKKIIVYHPAFGYFLDEYGFEQVPIEIAGKEPTAAQLKDVIDEALEENSRIIFVQKQFSPKNAEAIANEINGTAIPIDPLAEDVVGNLLHIANIISNEVL